LKEKKVETSDPKRTQIFISYSHQDTDWLKRLRVHMKPLEVKYGVDVWDDTRIKSGSKWRKEIKEAIQSARVALLLVSADFIASDFIRTDELPPLLNAAGQGGTTILPVIVSPCRYEQEESLSQFQSVNPPSRPLTGMTKHEQEEIFVKVANDIEKVLIAKAADAEQRMQLMQMVQRMHPEEKEQKQARPIDEESAVRAVASKVATDTHIPRGLQASISKLQTARVRKYFTNQKILKEATSSIESKLPIELVAVLVMQGLNKISEINLSTKMEELEASVTIARARKEGHINDYVEAYIRRTYNLKSVEELSIEISEEKPKLKESSDAMSSIISSIEEMIATPIRNIR
jgi:hypothetical protein